MEFQDLCSPYWWNAHILSSGLILLCLDITIGTLMLCVCAYVYVCVWKRVNEWMNEWGGQTERTPLQRESFTISFGFYYLNTNRYSSKLITFLTQSLLSLEEACVNVSLTEGWRWKPASQIRAALEPSLFSESTMTWSGLITACWCNAEGTHAHTKHDVWLTPPTHIEQIHIQFTSAHYHL